MYDTIALELLCSPNVLSYLKSRLDFSNRLGPYMFSVLCVDRQISTSKDSLCATSIIL